MRQNHIGESQSENNSPTLSRKEFIHTIMTGVIALPVIACLGSCSDNVSTPSNVDFTIDTTTTALKDIGGSVVQNGVIVVRTSATEFIAVQAACTHEGATIAWQGSSFRCPRHGATFSSNGTRTSGPAEKNLATYKTTLTGTSLRISS